MQESPRPKESPNPGSWEELRKILAEYQAVLLTRREFEDFLHNDFHTLQVLAADLGTKQARVEGKLAIIFPILLALLGVVITLAVATLTK